jgi:medium-chain acyl-[acyl-carrier-protein] hydrolase
MDTLEHTFTVKTYDCHPNGMMKLSALMQQFQEIASVHAQQLNFGSDRLAEINCYWVLSNLRIEFGRLPRWKEAVLLQTWPSGHNRLLATREFLGRDETGRELFRAASQWMILEKKSNRPKNLVRLNIDLLDAGAKVFETEPARLEPQRHYTHQGSIQVPYSALDLNGHVNNTEYVRWAFDSLHQNFELTAEIHSLQISYLSEAFENNTLDLQLAQDQARYFVLGRKARDDSKVFILEINH